MYGKLFSSMYDGSIYGQWEAIVTFQQLIILADKDGTIEMTPQALAARTSIPLEILNKGLEILESPDTSSRTPDEEGRRIVRIEPTRAWGWHITNYAKYRAIRTAEERREYHKQYWHKRKNKNQPASTGTQQNQPIVEVEAKVEVEAINPPYPPWLDIEAWGEFVQHRKDSRKPLTPLASKKNMNILEAHRDSQKEIVDKTIANGWKGLFPPDKQSAKRPLSAVERVELANQIKPEIIDVN